MEKSREVETMDQLMTIAEIESQYHDEWVLVGDPETNEDLEVLSGKVLCHSADRNEFDRRMVELKPKRFAILFTGQSPDNLTFVL